MNLMQLKYFRAVCTYRTISAAAEYLHISQPSLSSAVKELEKSFGVALFHRRHSGMELTAAGETLYKMSEDLINRAEQLEKVMNDLGAERKSLRLGIPPMIGSILLPKIYREFLHTNSDIDLEITEAGSNELLKKLSDDYLDMVFLTHNRPLEQSLTSKHIMRLEIVCCASKNNPLSQKKIITSKELDNVPLVLFKNSFFQTEEIKKWFSLSKVNPKILLQTEQLSTVLSLISNDIAVGFMFRQLIEEHSELKAIPVYKPMYADVSLVWKKDAYQFSCMKKFKEYMQLNSSI